MAIGIAILFATGFSLTDCAPAANRQAANGALDVVQIGCVVANMWLDVPAIAQVCGVADKLLPDLRAIVNSMRTAAVAGVPRCAADGGACLPKDAGAE